MGKANEGKEDEDEAPVFLSPIFFSHPSSFPFHTSCRHNRTGDAGEPVADRNAESPIPEALRPQPRMVNWLVELGNQGMHRSRRSADKQVVASLARAR